MPVTAPKDTLAYHTARPLVQHRDMSSVPCKSVAAAAARFMNQDGSSGTLPETEALWFYALNQGMAELGKQAAPYEPLGERRWLPDLYHTAVAPKAVRAFYYLLLICTRETRHVHNDDESPLAKDVKKQFGAAAWAFNKLIRGKGSEAAYKTFLSSPPPLPIGAYANSLRHIFYHGKWSGGFGGQAWGQVADCLCRFVSGEFTAEMMLDTVWTLCHNNGPIFNRGMLYGMYSQNLIRILDVQRAGQVVEMILDDAQVKPFVNPALIEAATGVRAMFPEAVGDFVDWFAVEALGATKKYKPEQQAQLAAHGISPQASKAQQIAAQKLEAQKAAELKAKAEHNKQYFEVMPGVLVKKLQRAA